MYLGECNFCHQIDLTKNAKVVQFQSIRYEEISRWFYGTKQILQVTLRRHENWKRAFCKNDEDLEWFTRI